MRFYNRTIASYRTNIQSFHSIVQNHFRRNYSKRRAGESTGKVGTEQINSHEHHRQEAIKVISTPKQLQSLQNLFFKKSAITHHSIPSINTPINPSSNPSSHPTLRSASGQGERPRAPDAPRIKHDKMKQFYMIDMERKRW